MTEPTARLMVEAAERGDKQAVRILGGLDELPLDGAWLNQGNDAHPKPQIMAMLFKHHSTTSEDVERWGERLGVEWHILKFTKAEP